MKDEETEVFYSRVKLLATCPSGKEEKAEVELLDALLPWDSSVEVLKTDFPGVLLVKTNLGPKEALRAVRAMEMAYVSHVFPVHEVAEADIRAITRACLSLARRIGLGEGHSFAVRCRRRGRIIKSSVEVEKAVGKALKEATKAKVKLKGPDITFRIEVLGRIAFIGLIRGRSSAPMN